MKIPLRKPLVLGVGDGAKTLTEVEVDVDKITGADIMFAIREAAAVNGIVLSYKIDAEVHLQALCKLTGIPREILLKHDGADFNRLLGPVSNFFVISD
jgi:hypothetical protein